jgi:hypothetical protein
MKNRNLVHSDNWQTPLILFNQMKEAYDLCDFDPCPLGGLESGFDGLSVDWEDRCFVNPPYSAKLKAEFVKKAISEAKLGRHSVFLIPVSTSTVLFHEHILPNQVEIKFLRGRINFEGINAKGEWVNPFVGRVPQIGTTEDMPRVRQSGMHDSMLVLF